VTIFYVSIALNFYIAPHCPTAVPAFQGLTRAADDSSSLVCQFSCVLLDFGFTFWMMLCYGIIKICSVFCNR